MPGAERQEAEEPRPGRRHDAIGSHRNGQKVTGVGRVDTGCSGVDHDGRSWPAWGHWPRSRRRRSAYADANLRVRSSGIVHAVAMTRWLDGERMPGPACMVGVSGWDPGATHPDRGPATCQHCLKLVTPEEADPGQGEQLELFGI